MLMLFNISFIKPPTKVWFETSILGGAAESETCLFPFAGFVIIYHRKYGRGAQPGKVDPARIYFSDYCAPPCDTIFSITWSRLKLAAFMRGGYSLKVPRKFPTKDWAGTSRKARSRSQS